MHKQPHRNRFVALLLGVAALLSAASAIADPPVRVVRLGYTSGPVSFSPAGENDWVQATVNRPLVTGDRLWGDVAARAELQVGPVAIRMGSTTSVTLLNLDDRVVQLQLAQGALDIRVRGFEAGHVLEIDTPNLAFSILRAGDYRIDVDAAGNATTVVTRSGQAEVYGERAAYVVDAGAAYRFYGTGLVDYEFLDVPQPDDLDRWAFERDRRWENSVSARYVSPEVIGYQDLDANGVWRVEAGYGNVWVPNRLVIGWAPYRDGHWAWIDPWGWTWIDSAPWGFAVSHYGRWASVRDTWCWVPGPVRARAVYAPALVAFIGGNNFQVAIAGGSVGAVAWFPLGPHDVYRPAYPVSRTYFNSINTTNTVINVTNITNVYNNRDVTNVTYANQRVHGAVVAVPTTTFVQAQPVSRAALRMGREAVVNAPVTPVAAVAPTPVSVRGPADPGHRPPVQVLDRQMIAKTAPPAVPVPFASKERLLAENPGKPLDRSAMGTLKPFVPVPAPRVQVVAPTQTAGTARVPPAPRGQAEQRGQPDQRGAERTQPPMAVSPPSTVAPSPTQSVPEQRGRTGTESRVPPPTVAAPPSGVAPAPVPEQRARVQPPTLTAPPQGVAPAPIPVPPASNMRRPEQRSAPVQATPPAPQAVPVPPPQRAQPEQRSGPEPSRPMTAAPAPPPAAVPVPPPQRAPSEQRARPEPAQAQRPVAPPPPARPMEPRPPAGAAPPPANVEQHGPGGKAPPPARQDKKTPEQQKADDDSMKRK